MAMSNANKAKLIIAGVLVVLVLVVVFQNWQPAETRLLWMRFEMPRTVLLFVTLLVGFITGSLVGSYIVQKRRR